MSRIVGYTSSPSPEPDKVMEFEMTRLYSVLYNPRLLCLYVVFCRIPSSNLRPATAHHRQGFVAALQWGIFEKSELHHFLSICQN